ncbi:M36 family metallopeptidase [Egicoccus halophilus]|uniref:Peptidase M36 n=1 Tax=Egicoccus halophilus TaxID=1670830 RepID=A0A8J3AGN3_9ACTN|nr:M36 family metallopeptidase [Egicoccus halophilus]GGI07960.1 peptidase M36 [Egicoccus halophilus]
MRHKRPYWLVAGLTLAISPLTAMPVTASPATDPSPATSFLTGPNTGDPDDIAIEHLRREAATYGLTAADLTELTVRSSFTSAANGATHVNLNQQHQGLEVFGADTTVTIAADGAVAYVGGTSVSGLHPAPGGAAGLDAPEAVEAAADALDLDEPEGLRTLQRRRSGDTPEVVLTDGGISDEPITARRGWHPTEQGLRPAWQVVIDDATDVHLWNATVDAATGDLLDVDDWTVVHDEHELADRLQQPADQTAAAAARLSAGHRPGATTFVSGDPVRDGSSYRIFPGESPDDGDRVVSTEPADGTASPFGWHDVSGTPEPDYTITRGNNVHAYTDRDADNQPDPGSEPDGGPGLTFDDPIDLGEHPQNATEAALTNLFWWCNVSHDLFHLYGFDEPAGNFQVNNYGRGGVGGDDVRCEGMDGSGQNNANFSTPAADGGRPRMQTMIEFGSGLPNAVTIDAGPAAGTYLAQYARFTPAPTSTGTAGALHLVDDGVGAPNDGCQPYTLPAGAIAVVDTTTACTNHTQARNAESAGAAAVVVVHTAATPALMTGSMNPRVNIPAIRVGANDGATIKAALADGPVAGSVHRNLDRPPMRVGDLDVATIIHEYGHGVSLRLTGGPGVNCLSGNEQAGEGWSDFFALVALLDAELDDPEGPRGIFPYVVFQPPRADGAGLRPRPYSRNMEIQPFTYDSIKSGGWLNGGSLSAPHGIGHGFAAVMWDLTWDLIDVHGFNPNLYDDWSTGGNNLSLQLVMDGLKIQGCNPGLLDVRDAIIVADELLTGGDNACTLWSTFARRGFGYRAEQGTTNRNDNTEAYDTHPDCLRPLLSPVSTTALDDRDAGATVPVRFDLGRNQGLDVFASNAPYSRQVDCDTRQVVSQGEHVTPRAVPVTTGSPGKTGLSVNARGVYHYLWQTEAAWVGTCRELVVTMRDGTQYRAVFRFV